MPFTRRIKVYFFLGEKKAKKLDPRPIPIW
jgi:hypothetical protein